MWNEKSFAEKTVTVISYLSMVALAVALILKYTNYWADAHLLIRGSLAFEGFCQVVLNWKTNRGISWGLGLASILLVASLVLEFFV